MINASFCLKKHNAFPFADHATSTQVPFESSVLLGRLRPAGQLGAALGGLQSQSAAGGGTGEALVGHLELS